MAGLPTVVSFSVLSSALASHAGYCCWWPQHTPDACSQCVSKDFNAARDRCHGSGTWCGGSPPGPPAPPGSVVCPGTASTCAGNECCPGTDASGGKKFPCPTADPALAQCEGGIEETVKALVSALTTEEKHTFVRGGGWKGYDTQHGYYIGNAGLKNRYGIPTLNMQDNGQGFRTTSREIIDQVTSWPEALAVASSWSENDTFAWAAAMGKEFKIKGSNVILGPGLNLHRVGIGGRNGEYVTGEASYFGARMAKPYVEGVQAQGVLAVAKHYILNNQETNRDNVDSHADARTMWEVYYPPFEAAIAAGAGSVMCSYNLVNGMHACGNPKTLKEDLKGDMGFEGWVQSDWWALHRFAAEDGVDQEMPGSPAGSNTAHYTDDNLRTLSDGRLDDMVTRMLKPMMKYGLFQPKNSVCTPPDCGPSLYEAVATNEEHQKLNKELAAKAVILLKNEDKVLPLARATIKKLALVGPACDAAQDVDAQLGQWDLGSLYNIGGSGRVIASNPESISAGVTAACKTHGCSVTLYTGTDADAAVTASEGADAVILCGGSSSTEGHDRDGLSVEHEDFLVAVAGRFGRKPVIAVTLSAAVIVMPWIHQVDAAMHLFLAGKYTGSALADALFGDRNPSAKLLVTIPNKESDVIGPCHATTCPYTEKLNVGHVRLQAEGMHLFPFGHGLSYTSFETASELTVEEDQETCHGAVKCVKLLIKNTGDRAGADVWQLYLDYPSVAGEPLKQLRGFQRTKELAPGETERLVFPLRSRDLSIYNAETKQWEVPTGSFVARVGPSMTDIRSTGRWEMQSDMVVTV